ncbi:DNA cytosine methyltransferase [Seohaeicola nanhaiensis]|uniref:DNA (cytosine-5-)-methyltransferase n=1 Tax=Seohaeicola nanhaiensis TaxID=1387282 RepID=A0ABV9KFK7_9RHOB
MTSLPLIIDSFAGGGGASTGIEMALGRSPDVAINHNAAALALHAANHPDTLHLDSNIWEVDPYEVAGGRHVGLLWASPDCKHFSKAKGGAPKDRNIRDLAWVVVDWAEKVKPDVICMENVEEFRTWGPVGEDGQPIKEFQGQTFELWIKRLRKVGYRVQFRELRGCDYGAATIRKRFFMVARRDGRPIVWPKPTHGDPNSPAVQRGKLQPWRTAAECIDWSLPCPSIFDSSAEILAKHQLRSVRPLADNTLARIARGMGRYVLRETNPFVVNLTHGARLEDPDAPLRTITCANRGEKAVVVPTIVGCGGRAGQSRPRGGDEPFATVTAKADACIATATLAPSITRFNGGATGQDLREPLATITANSWIKKPGGAMPLGMIAPSLMSLKGTDRRAGPADAPHPTILAGGGHSSLIAPLLVQTGYGERHGQAARSLDPFAPLGTVVAGGVKHAAAAVFLAQHNTGVTGHDARDPLSTVAQTGSHQTPVAAFFAKYYGQGCGSRVDEPLHTVTVQDRFGHVQIATAAPPFTPDQADRARQVADFLRAHGEWDDREFVTAEVEGDTFVVVDIGMRMLTPRELFNAQGFPADYVIEGVWDERGGDWSFQEFPKHVQISCCGNSVCPDVAAALVGANCGHLASAAAPERETADA